MNRTIQIVGGGLFLVMLGLSELSRRFPHVGWLQPFRFNRPHLSQEHRARMGRRAAVLAGAQLIVIGIALPMAYVALTVMMFNDITKKAMALVLTGSVVCIGLGVTAIVTALMRRDRG